jgi:hypothetical protein
MAALWKAWKAKGRLPTLSTSPLGISPKGAEIPTFPQLRRRFPLSKPKHNTGGLSPPARGGNPRPPSMVPFCSAAVGNFPSALDKGHGMRTHLDNYVQSAVAERKAEAAKLYADFTGVLHKQG